MTKQDGMLMIDKDIFIDDDNDDDTAGGLQAFVPQVFRAHTLMVMLKNMVLMTNDHSDFHHDHDPQDAGPLGWLPSPQPDLHGLSVPSCQPGQG